MLLSLAHHQILPVGRARGVISCPPKQVLGGRPPLLRPQQGRLQCHGTRCAVRLFSVHRHSSDADMRRVIFCPQWMMKQGLGRLPYLLVALVRSARLGCKPGRPKYHGRLCQGVPTYTVRPRQWPEVSDFVARFCTLRESETHGHARIARVSSRNVQKSVTQIIYLGPAGHCLVRPPFAEQQIRLSTPIISYPQWTSCHSRSRRVSLAVSSPGGSERPGPATGSYFCQLVPAGLRSRTRHHADTDYRILTS